jgi:uncharacterized phiE125 gp8 family phage protein
MATQPPEPLDLATVKDYLRVLDSTEDAKISAMIPRSRLWVEEYTGLALIKRDFAELHTPRAGSVRLYRGPLVALASCTYPDSDGAAQDFTPIASPPSTKLTGDWPATGNGQPFTVTYTAGVDPGTEDDRLIGAMLTLIEGEYSAGFAYPPDTVTSAINALFFLKFVAP